MRRRTRIDLNQQISAKEESRLDRKRERWAARNKDKPPQENPFLAAIKPDNSNYGDATENVEELRSRLKNLEFGNFPGYFNYRKNAALNSKHEDVTDQIETGSCHDLVENAKQDARQDGKDSSDHSEMSLDAGLSDERLGLMKAEWFSNKEVLDIGCNRGHIAYSIARLYSPKFVLGIDIDERMINMANRDLHLHIEEGLMNESNLLRRLHAAQLNLNSDSKKNNIYEEAKNHFPLSSYVSHGPLALVEPVNSPKFPNNVMFVEHNYVVSRDELVEKQKPYFDTILCLSVTKWIHLNYCDAGLKRFFKRIYNHLRPNGLLVLEAQPFDNYGRRKKLSDRLRANYHSIQFKPDKFDDYLLSSEVGFKEILHSTTTNHKCTGFKRPLKVFLK